MKNNRARSTSRRRLMLLTVLALGLASAAQAQDEHAKPATTPKHDAAGPKHDAAASKPSSVGGVTVNAQRRRTPIPTDKAEAYAAQAAKDDAWRKYRKSMPPLTNSPNDDSKDFPGIQIRAPQ
jgi:type IV secretory pathway VirJ component